MEGQIFENDYLRVFHSHGASPFMMGSFSHLGFQSGRSRYWGQSRFENLGIEAIGIVAKANDFYPPAGMQEAFHAVRTLLKKPIILYGHSMGGYAAIKYSGMFGAAGAIASCPMVTIDPHDVPDDRRYHSFFDPVLNADMKIRASDVAGSLAIIYDRFERQDRFHAEMLRASLPAGMVREVYADFFGHEAVQVMIDQFVFANLVGQNFHGLSLPGLLDHIRRSKKANPKYLINLATHVLDRAKTLPSREKTLRAVLGRIEAMPPIKVEWFVEVRMARILSRLEVERGNLGTAIDLLKRALSVEEIATGRREPNLRLELANLWEEFGCSVQSAELLSELVMEGQCQPEAGRRLSQQRQTMAA